MPPKTRQGEITEVSSDQSGSGTHDLIVKISLSLTDLHGKVDRIESQMSSTAADVTLLKTSLNDLEQHNRGECLKIFNFPVDKVASSNNVKYAKFLHEKLFSPILKLAVDDNYLDQVPSTLDFINLAHPLRSKSDRCPAIHVRLRSKIYKEALFRYKKSYFLSLDKAVDKPTIVHDLTRQNADLLKRTKERVDVESAWFNSSKVCYKLKEDLSKVLVAKL